MFRLPDRRQFMGAAGAAGLTLSYTGHGRAARAGEKLVVGIMGTGNRGLELSRLFAGQKGVEVAYVCDVDRTRADRATEEVVKVADGQRPRPIGDFRRILDDRAVDILVVAACNHWHAPAAILACAAGKHVYVEKPCSHNPREGELMVAAARKHNKRVQMGNQRRSWAVEAEGIQKVREGAIGRAYLAEAFYTNLRPSIGKGTTTTPPATIDYDLWQGPVPRRPFRSNYLHYNWHWFWHWGNGELGNNGVHSIDLCRWGLGVEYPIQVSSTGGRFRHDDDQETPDTSTATFQFEGGKAITWTGLSCNRRPGGRAADVIFHGAHGSLALGDGSYTLYDEKGREISHRAGMRDDSAHVLNFLEAIRTGARLNSDIEEGHKSTLLCHLGNISYRTRRLLRCNPKDGSIIDDREAQALWKREYEKGWQERLELAARGS
ncbi:MAG: Gfo/Idh/MocA family oxidoreductase [Planctomycetia bacterium]|nr:Gfo/Idh/MocA family oxidoreductase [Planctomycetia bacterium]